MASRISTCLPYDVRVEQVQAREETHTKIGAGKIPVSGNIPDLRRSYVTSGQWEKLPQLTRASMKFSKNIFLVPFSA